MQLYYNPYFYNFKENLVIHMKPHYVTNFIYSYENPPNWRVYPINCGRYFICLFAIMLTYIPDFI